MAKQERRDWSELQPELLELIMQRLNFMDYVNCRQVCWSWRKVVDDAVAKPAPFPFLMSLPPLGTPKLLSVTQNTHYTLSCNLDPYCYCSERGWMVSLLVIDNPVKALYKFRVTFLNPVSASASASEFKLPPLFYSPPIYIEQDADYACRLVFSSEPHSPHFIVALLFMIHIEGHAHHRRLAFYHATHKSWTLYETQVPYFSDIAIHGSKFYALTQGELQFLTVFDLTDPSLITSQTLTVAMLENAGTDRRIRYLVTDFTLGELLCVFRLTDDYITEYPNSRVEVFRVFKLDLNGPGPRWLKVDSLGNRILLLLDTGGQIVSTAAEIIGCNCIFLGQTNTLSVYSLADRSIKHLPLDSCFSLDSNIRWFTPTPC